MQFKYFTPLRIKIITTLLSISVIFYILNYIDTKGLFPQGLFVNLLAGTIGSLITVLTLEWITEKQKIKNKLMNNKIVGYEIDRCIFYLSNELLTFFKLEIPIDYSASAFIFENKGSLHARYYLRTYLSPKVVLRNFQIYENSSYRKLNEILRRYDYKFQSYSMHLSKNVSDRLANNLMELHSFLQDYLASFNNMNNEEVLSSTTSEAVNLFIKYIESLIKVEESNSDLRKEGIFYRFDLDAEESKKHIREKL